MRYSEMTTDMRSAVFPNPDNYPLRVTFLGKIGLLGSEGVALLLNNGVDFEVDDSQLADILAKKEAMEPEWPSAGDNTLKATSLGEATTVQGAALMGVFSLPLLLNTLRRLIRDFPKRQ